MTKELMAQFKSNAHDALESILNDLSSDDTRGYFLVVVRNTENSGIEDTPYSRLYDALVNDFGWDWGVVEEELADVVDEIADEFIDAYPKNDEDAIDEDELEEYFDELTDEYLEEQGLEVVTWPESQMLMELPHHRKHAQLINSEEGLDKFGSSAYVVEESWLDDFRNDNLYD